MNRLLSQRAMLLSLGIEKYSSLALWLLYAIELP